MAIRVRHLLTVYRSEAITRRLDALKANKIMRGPNKVINSDCVNNISPSCSQGACPSHSLPPVEEQQHSLSDNYCTQFLSSSDWAGDWRQLKCCDVKLGRQSRCLPSFLHSVVFIPQDGEDRSTARVIYNGLCSWALHFSTRFNSSKGRRADIIKNNLLTFLIKCFNFHIFHNL